MDGRCDSASGDGAAQNVAVGATESEMSSRLDDNGRGGGHGDDDDDDDDDEDGECAHGGSGGGGGSGGCGGAVVDYGTPPPGLSKNALKKWRRDQKWEAEVRARGCVQGWGRDGS